MSYAVNEAIDKGSRVLFETNLDAMFIAKRSGKILAANLAACQLFQRTAEDLCYISYLRLVDVTDARLPDAVEEVERLGKFQGRLTYRHLDESQFEAQV